MITLALLGTELPIIIIGSLVAIYFASDPHKRRLTRAYRRHRKDVQAMRHIKYFEDLVTEWSRRE